VQLTEAQHRLEAANARLWSGLAPDALGRLYDRTGAVGASAGGSVICGVMVEALRAGGSPGEVQAAVLPALQQAHWAIHRAFSEHQRVGEDRLHLAAEIGELIAGFVAALVAAGWSETEARQADVHALAEAAASAR